MGKTAIKAPRFDGFRLEPENVVIIGLDTDDGPEHPRYDERVKLPLKEETVVNFMKVGVHTPISVCVMPDGSIEVDDGRRRCMHAREANRRLTELGDPTIKVPATVARGSDDHHALLGVILNEHREDDALLIKITKAKRLFDRTGELSEVANAFGVSQNAVRKWLKIDELPASIKAAVARGVLSANAAAAMHGLPRDEQMARLQELKDLNSATGKRATAKQAKSGPGKTGPRRTTPRRMAKLEAALDAGSYAPSSHRAGILKGLMLAGDADKAAEFLSELDGAD